MSEGRWCLFCQARLLDHPDGAPRLLALTTSAHRVLEIGLAHRVVVCLRAGLRRCRDQRLVANRRALRHSARLVSVVVVASMMVVALEDNAGTTAREQACFNL